MEAEDAEIIFRGEVDGEFGPLACFESEGDGLRGRGVVSPGDFSPSAFGGKDAEGDFCGTAELTGASAKEICQAGGLDQFSVSRAVKQLVELGYARRQAGRSDRRYAAIELSESGWSAFTEISDVAKRLDADLTSAVSEKELAALDSILTRLDNASAGILARGWRGAADAPVDPADATAKRDGR